MRLRITIAMLEIRNRETLQSKVNVCKSDVKIGDYADSLQNTKLKVVTISNDSEICYPLPSSTPEQLLKCR